MTAQRHFAETAHDFEQAPSAKPRKQAPVLANAGAEPRVSPARMLQDELRRAFSPGPIVAEQFSTRRALKFIAPTWLGAWGLIALMAHIGHH
jgi:hypothetical protein